ncbi:STAS domain-containing protein [Streptomyces sp. NPDC087903]|uniref:STAS domain-containing protein n=1 Tax=Streptomyces sp. NPDC087903 TaxID=3365819 RepID=UPI0038164E08
MRHSALTISRRQSADSTAVLILAGEIDHTTAPHLGEALQDLRVAVPRQVLDLTAVTFLDSSGIDVLIHAHRNAAEGGGFVRLAAAGPAVLRPLQIVGVDELIPHHPSLDEALAHSA